MKVGESTIYKHPRADTFYMSIPAKMATDSICPFSVGDIVELEFVKDSMVVRKKK